MEGLGEGTTEVAEATQLPQRSMRPPGQYQGAHRAASGGMGRRSIRECLVLALGRPLVRLAESSATTLATEMQNGPSAMLGPFACLRAVLTSLHGRC